MTVPEQVRKQTEAVQKLYEDLNKEANTPSPGNGEGASAEVVAINGDGVPANGVDDPAPQPKPVERGRGNQGEDPNSETFEQRWRTLQGMYDADVPRLHAQNQELVRRVQQMEQLVATMQSAPAPKPTPEPKSTLTEDEIEEYGESIDIMRKVSQEVAWQYQQRIDSLQATIEQLRGHVVPRVEHLASQNEQRAEQSFWAELQAAVPNWREINENPAFQSWLLEVDTLSGLSKQTYLDDAQRNQDAARVASFFTSWQTASGAPAAQPNRSKSQSELEKQVSPGRGRTGPTPTAGPRTYTPQDITAFFADVRTGRYRGKEQDRDAIERDIFAAQREGRIVQA